MIELILLDGSTINAPLTNPHRVLAREEMRHYQMLRSDTRRREFLLGRILLKAALIERNNCFTNDFQMISPTLSATGKPAVAGAEFNLAHDENAVLLAIGDQVVGVDVERVQYFDDAMMKICFSAAERHRIARTPRPDRMATLLWCMKEAAAKATGDGLLSELEGQRKTKLFFRGGFLNIAGHNRAYAVCSPCSISPISIYSALSRFDQTFATLQTYS
jgi:phosphopantetheinyl transferase